MGKISNSTTQIATPSQCFGLPSPAFYRSMRPTEFRRYHRLGREIISACQVYGGSDMPYDIHLAIINMQCTILHRQAAPELFDALFPGAYADAVAWLGCFDEDGAPPNVYGENVLRYLKVAHSSVQ